MKLTSQNRTVLAEMKSKAGTILLGSLSLALGGLPMFRHSAQFLIAAFVVSVLQSLVGCTTLQPCEERLGDDWTPIAVPEFLRNERNSEYSWFERTNGDMIGCARMRTPRVCSSVNEVFVAARGWSEEIICMS
jgi:hypothetical protein